MNDRKKVLILCTGNSARSQIAEAVLRHVSEFEVHSAGVEPAAVKPEVKVVLDEISIGSDGLRSKSVDEFAGQEFDHIITVCDGAKQNCPMFPGNAEGLHWSIADPAEVGGDQRLEAFRRARDELVEKLTAFADRT
jgi:arsenate reductase